MKLPELECKKYRTFPPTAHTYLNNTKKGLYTMTLKIHLPFHSIHCDLEFLLIL